MSFRPWLRTGVLILGGMLALSATACGNGNGATPEWSDGSPSPSAAASGVLDAASATATPTAAPTTPGAGTKKTPASGDTNEDRSTKTGGGARVTVVRAGGIAGVSETLTVEANGHWSYQDRRRGGKSQSGTLSANQRQSLQGLLADPALARERGSLGTCADGYSYALTSGSATVLWRECGGTVPKTASSVVRLLVGATAF